MANVGTKQRRFTRGERAALETFARQALALGHSREAIAAAIAAETGASLATGRRIEAAAYDVARLRARDVALAELGVEVANQIDKRIAAASAAPSVAA